MSTGNDGNLDIFFLSIEFLQIRVYFWGMTLIEEGEMTGSTMKLQAEYLVLNPLLKSKEPKLVNSLQKLCFIFVHYIALIF